MINFFNSYKVAKQNEGIKTEFWDSGGWMGRLGVAKTNALDGYNPIIMGSIDRQETEERTQGSHLRSVV